MPRILIADDQADVLAALSLLLVVRYRARSSTVVLLGAAVGLLAGLSGPGRAG